MADIDEDLQRARSKRIDFEFRRPDGRVIDVGLSIAGLPLPDGTRGYLYTFQDVTEVKRMERNARMQQRLAAVGEMAAGIAHEIRNPLASMSGSMQMLRQELSLSGDQAQLMDIVLRESDRLNQTIKSFLAYARPQRAQSTRLDLRTLVTETAMLLRNGPDVGERHAVGLAVGEAEVPCEGDESQVRQILWNLATNALRAMPHGGELTLGARLERGTATPCRRFWKWPTGVSAWPRRSWRSSSSRSAGSSARAPASAWPSSTASSPTTAAASTSSRVPGKARPSRCGSLVSSPSETARPRVRPHRRRHVPPRMPHAPDSDCR